MTLLNEPPISTNEETNVPTAPEGIPASSSSVINTGVLVLSRTGASLTAVILIADVTGAERLFEALPSFTCHVIVRDVEIAVGLSLVDA